MRGIRPFGFLLLLAIADDAAGLAILAVFYPSGDLALAWLLLSVAAAVAVWLMANWLPRRMDRGRQDRPNSTWARRVLGAWPYVIAGCLSWYAFYRAGLHPALGLLPIIPAIPHAEHDFGIFAEEERHATDLLNSIEHALKVPVQLVLCAFGLVNAGVELSAVSAPTLLVLAGLMIGKPLGITLFGWFAANVLQLGLPEGMTLRDLPVVGCVAAIGFTVALFVASVAFPAGPVQDAAKMGALLSLASAILALLAGRLAAVRRTV
ncbi:Na+/H+ antiporter NhaA [Paracoccus lutimaris]|uniref:Putative Na(+)/H(+) antiporter NhaA homolog n=1 Tax=Paracoccus lutimaris TaxID=1490030 RepID=A0A368YFU6_9RHOB|nr:Na+/H+ antiporter 1 [Paracoccus lutimaris]